MSEDFFREIEPPATALNSVPVFQERPRTKVASRGTQIDRERVRKNMGGSQFHMILVAARVTRDIINTRRKTEIDPYVSGVDGLLAVESGEINRDDWLQVPDAEFLQKLQEKQRTNDSWV